MTDLPYVISAPIKKSRTAVEIPDNYTTYIKIDPNASSISPLAFTLMLGYIQALSTDKDELEIFISKFV